MLKLKKLMEAFSLKYPQWDKAVADFFNSDEDEPDSDHQELMDEFGDILNKTIDIAKENNLSIENLTEVFQDFACWDFIQKFFIIKLESYYQYAALRKIAEDDIYKAKFCVDLIWSSYIIRFDPHMVFDEKVPMDEDGFKKVSAQLDRFVDRCVSRQINRASVIIDLEEESKLPSEICEYIADKFELDYNQIRMNYIIYRISSCERAIKELREKLDE